MKPIQVWPFDDAPPELLKQAESMNDIDWSDADWVAHVPDEYLNTYVLWLEDPHFGPRVKVFDLPDGSKLHVSYHA